MTRCFAQDQEQESKAAVPAGGFVLPETFSIPSISNMQQPGHTSSGTSNALPETFFIAPISSAGPTLPTASQMAPTFGLPTLPAAVASPGATRAPRLSSTFAIPPSMLMGGAQTSATPDQTFVIPAMSTETGRPSLPAIVIPEAAEGAAPQSSGATTPLDRAKQKAKQKARRARGATPL